MEQAARIGCVILAAGNSVRFGENKLTAEFRGRKLISYTLDAVQGDVFDAVLVVTQYPEIEQLAKSRGYTAVRNEHPDWGLSHTIALGTALLEGYDAILFAVADQPLLQSDCVARIVQAWRAHPDKICGASHDGRRGNPNIFPRAFFPELLRLTGDCGGSAVIRQHEAAFFPVETEKTALYDCDTPQALAQMESIP